MNQIDLNDLDDNSKQTDENYHLNFEGEPLKKGFGSSKALMTTELKQEIKEEAKTSILMFIPIFLAGIIGNAGGMVNVAFAGHIGTLEMSGVSLGVTLMNITGNSFSSGICTALDTLCSQENGAGNKRRVGVVANRGLFMLTVCACVVAFIWMFTVQAILQAFGQEHSVAYFAQVFLRYMTIAIFPMFWAEGFRRTFAAIGIALPQAISGAVSLATLIVFEIVFVSKLNWGVKGAALALTISYWAQFISLIVSSFFIKGLWKSYMVLPSKEIFQEIWTFLRLAIPGIIMICAEWWAYEIGLIFAGIIGSAELAAFASIIQVGNIIFQIPYSFGVVASSRVGNHLGAGNAPRAKRALIILLCMLAIAEVIYLSTAYLLRPYIGPFFSNDPLVQRQIYIFVIYDIVMCIPDGFQVFFGGVIRGAGFQVFGAFNNIVSFYFVALPLQALLAFCLRRTVQSLFLGLGAAPNIQLSLFVGKLIALNWNKLAEDISSELKQKSESNETTHLKTKD